MLLLAGCSRKYVVSFRNGRQVTTAAKPKRMPDGTLLLKDESGRTARVPEALVQEVAPASMANRESPQWVKPAAR